MRNWERDISKDSQPVKIKLTPYVKRTQAPQQLKVKTRFTVQLGLSNDWPEPSFETQNAL